MLALPPMSLSRYGEILPDARAQSRLGALAQIPRPMAIIR